MTASPLRVPTRPLAAASPGALLILAAALVGVAIAADGPLARIANGLGGLLWVTAALLLAGSLRGTRRPWLGALVAAAVIALLVLVVRPGDLAGALLGFALGGLVVALAAPTRRATWAMLMAAAWLPAHVLLRIAEAALAGQARVRTEPPPTAALVPLAMVLAALAAGLLVGQLRADRLPDSAATQADPVAG